jgi:hypothetical protein
VSVADNRQVDLGALAPAIYGVEYIPTPRLERLIDLNAITKRDFLPGEQEPAAFRAGEYLKLHLSTLRKVDAIADILNRIWDGTLRTNATWRRMYGSRVVGLVETVTDHWIYKLLGAIGIIVSLAVGALALF